MDIKNKELTDEKKNKEYYGRSDGNYMAADKAFIAHTVLDRIAWARKWVHELASRTHIDCGCKDGYLCLTLGAEGVECVGIDPSEDAIDEARLRVSEGIRNLATEPTFLLGTGEDLPDGVHADTVSCLEVIEHVIDPDKLLKKLSSAGSYVLICTPDIHGKHGLKDSERNPEHIRLYEKEELETLVSKYGTILESVIRDGQICIIYKSK
jgi:2-polyprenyl-3-methyl-5-hydroxy-6-metoxy-1,4-benzoquinol methylase